MCQFLVTNFDGFNLKITRACLVVVEYLLCSWHVMQAVKLLLSQLDKRDIIHTSDVPLVNLIALIMHTSTWVPTLQDAASKICMNKELQDAFERNIVNASQMGSTLAKMDFNSEDGVTLNASLLFHVLWLRW